MLQKINELVTVVKLGGSSITFKERTFSVDENALSNISSALSNFNGRLFVVHGGGSWGHPVAAAYGLSSFTYSNDIRGVSQTRLAMLELTKKVQRSLIDHGISVFFFPPQHLESMTNDLEGLYELKAVPLTYGDVLYERGKGYRIIGGDEIISRLSASIKIKRVLFIMRSKGILDVNGEPISVISLSGKQGISIEQVPIMKGNTVYTFKQARNELKSISPDATGGITYKLIVAERLVSIGVEVMFLSSDSQDNMVKALNGMKFQGTTVMI